MMSCGLISGNDVELINAIPDGYLGEIQQLTTGPLGLRVEWVDLPGVSIQRHHFTAGLTWKEQRVEEGLSLAVALAGEGHFGVHGVEFTPNDVLVQPPGVPLDYVMPRNMAALAVQVSPSVAKQLGWSSTATAPLIFRTSGAIMNAFVAACAQAIQRVQARDQSTPAPQAEMALRDHILARLAVLLDPLLAKRLEGFVPAISRREYALVRRAERWYASRDPGEKLAVTEMSEGLEVSMRTLHRAFATWTGVSPGRYFALCRLHEFRKRLGTMRSCSAPVTRAAMDAGFDHLGRLAGDYRTLFGETPSETLQRWGDGSTNTFRTADPPRAAHQYPGKRS